MTGRWATRRVTGRHGEALAARYAVGRGWQVVATNVRLPSGEIDLIVRDGSVLAMIEVRTRTTDAFGTGAESLTPRKRAHMTASAFEYLASQALDPDTTPWRVDLIAVVLKPGTTPEVEYLPDVLAS